MLGSPLARKEVLLAVLAVTLLAACRPPDAKPVTPTPAKMVPGQTATVMLPGDVPLVMVWCPPGAYAMGSPDKEQDRDESSEGPQHQVTLTTGFWIGQYEVTQAQWQAVTGSNPSKLSGNPSHPVDSVSWKRCQDFITALNGLGHGTFRLPSEAEWEYAARAGTTTRFPWGDDPGNTEIANHAWFSGNSASTTHPVGQKTPNAWGVCDTSGNVAEWCQDWYRNYPASAATDPRGGSTGSLRIQRGGSWNQAPGNGRSACRGCSDPNSSSNDCGFRLCITDPPH